MEESAWRYIFCIKMFDMNFLSIYDICDHNIFTSLLLEMNLLHKQLANVSFYILEICVAGRPVTDLAIHPSDKLALSIGGDKTLRTWNLIKGRPAFTINLASKGVTMPTEIVFSPGGDRFSLISQQTVDVWTISKAGVDKRITCGSKPTSVQWISDEIVIVGLENGNIITLTVSDTQAQTYAAHRQRVKSLYFENNTLYSASSSGELKVWSVEDSKLNEICSNNAGCRVTCLTLNRQNHLVKKEEHSDVEENVVNEESDNANSVESDGEVEEASPPLKRKPGAFVTISYNSDEDKDITPPVMKKPKRKKRNKKQKNKKNQIHS